MNDSPVKFEIKKDSAIVIYSDTLIDAVCKHKDINGLFYSVPNDDNYFELLNCYYGIDPEEVKIFLGDLNFIVKKE